MNKQELIHMHNLLAEVELFFEDHGVEIIEDEYKNVSVQPIEVHRGIEKHEEAVLALSKDISENTKPSVKVSAQT